jgi:LysM repeat protein
MRTATALRGIVAGPARARRWWLQLVARLTGSALGLLVVTAAVVAYMVTLRPDVDRARRLARAELGLLLEPGEQVQAAAWARRREWWDSFRETYGLLVLTERRALFIGVPPRELLPPEPGPEQFAVSSLLWTDDLTARRTRVDLGTAAGVVLATERQSLTLASDDRTGTDSILASIARGRARSADDAVVAQRTRAYEEQVARQAVYHVVGAGDALASIASRYGTTEAQLVTLNRLTSSTIRVGQRLLVKRADRGAGPTRP